MSLADPKITQLHQCLNQPDHPYVFIIAHRGCWKQSPENSAAAITAAIEAGADMVELDIRCTKDGAWVAVHDKNWARTSSLPGSIGDYGDAETSALYLRQSDGGPEADFTSEQPLFLPELLEICRHKIMINLDMKGAPLRLYPQIAAQIQDQHMQDHVILKKRFDFSATPLTARQDLQFLADLDRDAPLAQIAFMPVLFAQQMPCPALFRHLNAPAIEILYDHYVSLSNFIRLFRPEKKRFWINCLKVAHAPGFDDATALLDPDKVWGSLIEAGVSLFQTDETAELAAYRRQLSRDCLT